MLINKPYSKGDIVTIKLTSDTEIITRFVNQNDDGITIEKPMAFIAFYRKPLKNKRFS